MADELVVEAEVAAVLLDLAAHEGAELARGERLLLVHLGHHLLVAADELRARDPRVVQRSSLGVHFSVFWPTFSPSVNEHSYS